MQLKQRLAVVGVALISVLSLSGCIRTDVDAYVNSDAQIEKVSMTIAMNKQQVQQLASMGGESSGMQGVPTDLNSYKEMFLSQSSDGDRQKMEEACEFTESDIEWIATCGGDTASLSSGELSAGADILDGVTITKDGNMINVAITGDAIAGGQGELSSVTGGEAASAAMMGMQSKFRMHFPGKVTAVSGTGASIDPNDPNVLMVDLLAVDGSEITASAESGSANMMMYVFGGLIVLIIVGGVAFFLFRSKDSGSGDGSGGAPASYNNAGFHGNNFPGAQAQDGELFMAPESEWGNTPPAPQQPQFPPAGPPAYPASPPSPPSPPTPPAPPAGPQQPPFPPAPMQ